MAHCNTVMNQIVKIFSRHEFESLAKQHHVKLDADSYLPTFISVAGGKSHEINRVRLLKLPQGSFFSQHRGSAIQRTLTG